MKAKRRGRPQKAGTLKNPPNYIKNRVLSRGGKQPHWDALMKNLDSGHAEIEAYRRSLRITHEAAEILLSSAESTITEKAILEVDAGVPCMRELGRMGGSAKGKSPAAWNREAENIFPRYAHHTARRAAHLALTIWPNDRCKKPELETLRKFFGRLKKILAK